MANVSVYNIEGKEVGSIELNDAVFGVEVNEHLVHMAGSGAAVQSGAVRIYRGAGPCVLRLQSWFHHLVQTRTVIVYPMRKTLSSTSTCQFGNFCLFLYVRAKKKDCATGGSRAQSFSSVHIMRISDGTGGHGSWPW